ncbi:alpha-ketoglutarate-dependent dioxygenase AlkB [Kocuria sp. ZOR0020]|uniref:alpha-ketoglutarate-dependent dioxygenase AlkB family protein n=1 Tax=Kocuria sp. ZOR0020 TaxID=1339234 RepID=UPI00068B9900|nr:alpha-ketoglutarate-dependent dioxygenase AlkB [Kocuria sp. ZOR0020]
MRRPSVLRGPGGPELFTIDRTRQDVAPGAVHVPDWLALSEQMDLVRLCRLWVSGPRPLKHRTLPGGGTMSAQSMVMGDYWTQSWFGESNTLNPQGSTLPSVLLELGARAIREAYGAQAPEVRSFVPTTALINFYGHDARMGMHQDLDETGDDPIVSISLGDTCVFRLGNTETRSRPYKDVELRSGDLFVFGRESRWAFHGVPAIRSGTGDPQLGMRDGGRLNITLRRTRQA